MINYLLKLFYGDTHKALHSIHQNYDDNTSLKQILNDPAMIILFIFSVY